MDEGERNWNSGGGKVQYQRGRALLQPEVPFRLRKRALDTKYGSKLWQYRTLVSRLELLALADPDSDIYVKFFADEIEVEVELLPSDDDKDGGPKGGTKGGNNKS